MSPKRKRRYTAVMITGAVALVVNQCIPSDGTLDPVTAVARTPGDSLTPASARPGETPPPSSIPELPFPRDIEPYDADSPIPDLFTPPESVVARGAAGEATPDGGQKTSVVGAARETFRLKHRLNGVLIDERLRIAIVDGMWLRTGQSLDGCVLSAVSGNEARFACHDGESVLEITDGSAGMRD